MSDNPCIPSFIGKFREQVSSFVNGRKRIVVCIIGVVFLVTGSAIADVYLRNLFPFLDLTGFSATYSNTGSVDLSGPFFQSLGTNGRTCETCHQPRNAFGLSAVNAQLRYFLTRGKDPLFAQFDGSTCPTGPINNSLVVNNGLIRIGLTVPPNTTDPDPPQYTITAVQDPYGCGLPHQHRFAGGARRFRYTGGRLPTTNLGFLERGHVRWTGVHLPVLPLNSEQTFAANPEHRS